MDKRLSALAVFVVFITLVTVRLSTYNGKHITWDVFGYYLYLPATFIEGDPLLYEWDWVENAWQKYDDSTTMFYLAGRDDGGRNYFFMMGMALMSLPWFLVGHLGAWLGAYPMDGFSAPYQLSMVLGFCIYSLIGLVFLRRILLKFFNEYLVAALLLIIGLGTNYFHFNSVTNLETGNMLFVLFTFIIWNTIRWHESEQTKYLFRCALFCGFMVLCKPSEAFCVLIPLLWGVASLGDLKARLASMWNKRGIYLKGSLLGLSVMIPQMTYWMIRTGSPIYDSYKNPGIGLDLFSPHTLDAFFSFKKGWLIYTPVMWLSLFGFYYLFKYQRKFFWVILCYFFISAWIITSWTEWWYGGSFSIRPMITSYALLVIPMGLLLKHWWERKGVMRIAALVLPIFFIVLNLFQTWQFRNYILHPYTTTRAYYFAVFGKTDIGFKEQTLLAWERTFEAEPPFINQDEYNCRNGQQLTTGLLRKQKAYLNAADTIITGRIGNGIQWGLALHIPFKEITKQTHAWIKCKVDVFIPSDFDGRAINFTATMNRVEGYYGYSSLPHEGLRPGHWQTIERTYLTPHIRNTNDTLEVYIWSGDGSNYYYDNLRLEFCERKDGK